MKSSIIKTNQKKQYHKNLKFFDDCGNDITNNVEKLKMYKYFGDDLKTIYAYKIKIHPFTRIATEIGGKITCNNGFYVKTNCFCA